jgi:hypothetical protein
MTELNFTPVPDGRVEVGGKVYMADTKGALVPVELIKPQHELQDQTVRKIVGFAMDLSATVARFKANTFADISALLALLEQEYGISLGGTKGNLRLLSFDGLMRVEVQVADYIDFGPELQVAKGLIDECLTEWAQDARPEIRALVTRAFNTDKAGQINRAGIFMLLRLDSSDPRWKRAMEAIRDAMRVVGSKTYVRVYARPAFDAPWQPVSIDLAKV